MSSLKKLKKMRSKCGPAQTKGLPDDILTSFLDKDSKLEKAIDEGLAFYESMEEEFSNWFKKPEEELIAHLQEHLLNFYLQEAINPYVAIAAKGPWVVTSHGAIIHDSGGYGMLGFAHGPKNILHALREPAVMANVMTANFSQRKFTELLRQEIGQKRAEGHRHPYHKFLCLNSGSESMTVAMRLADINAKAMTEGKFAGRKIKMLALKGGFHGRTERPAQASDSTMKAAKFMASFRDNENLVTVAPNDMEGLRKIFLDAEKQQIFYECMAMEPVMGEGNPGKAMTPDFYNLARQLTLDHGSILIVDSIQAGFRTTGYLSIMDYPGFEASQPPDMETYSKALNAGQFPLSVLAMTERAANLYRPGIYGNTMTTNPRALDVACAVLESFTPELRENIVTRGLEFVEKFMALKSEFPAVIHGVQGTGLLVSLSLNEKGYAVLGKHCLERHLREHGIGVIHGGKNALRFTPHFRITSEEIDLIVGQLREALLRGPIYN